MKTTKPLAVALMGLVAALAGGAPALAQLDGTAVKRTPDVVFVPTPQPVVEAMLRLASVQSGEMVYDLGCGDGRAVITAARDFGARGIGVDIDPERIQESMTNATQAGVNDRVQFKQADLFKMQFSDADVVFLYLLPALNLRLRPRILEELKPGTRIVSHAFSMDDWEPDDTTQVGGKTIYLWHVPAKVAGSWTVTLPDGGEATLALKQEFQKVSGTLQTRDRAVPISEGKLKGRTLTFVYGSGNDAGSVTAEVAGTTLNGTLARGSGAAPEKLTGRRAP